MSTTAPPSNWLQQALGRLDQDRFRIATNVDYKGQQLLATAHRSRFELTKFGNCETFFVFRQCPQIDQNLIRDISAESFQYASSSKSFPMPRGLFESVFCFSVCLVPGIDEATANAIRNIAPRMRWAAAEIPVAMDTTNNQLCYFQKTPAWGAAYYRGFRKQIQKYLLGQP